jgi:hypothetical protein
MINNSELASKPAMIQSQLGLVKKISNILEIKLYSYLDGATVEVSEDKKLFCSNIRSHEKMYQFRSGDSVLMVALLACDVETLKTIHQALPKEIIFTKAIFDALFLINDKSKEAVIKYLLCIDNLKFESYLKTFNHEDKLSDPIVKRCLDESRQQSTELSNNFDGNQVRQKEPCSPDGFRRIQSKREVDRHEKVIQSHLKSTMPKPLDLSMFNEKLDDGAQVAKKKRGWLNAVPMFACGFGFFAVGYMIKKFGNINGTNADFKADL